MLPHYNRKSESPANQHHTTKLGWTHDYNGNQVKLLDPMWIWVRGKFEVINEATLEKIIIEVNDGKHISRRMMKWVFALCAAVFLIVILGIGSLAMSPNGPSFSSIMKAIMNPVLWVAPIAGGVIPLFITRAQRLRKIKNIMLKHGCCPHCGYAINHVPPSADNNHVTTCPECASAWQLDYNNTKTLDSTQNNYGASTHSTQVNKRIVYTLLALTFIIMLAVLLTLLLVKL